MKPDERDAELIGYILEDIDTPQMNWVPIVRLKTKVFSLTCY